MSYPWLDIAFSLDNVFDFEAFKNKMLNSGLEHELTDSDYYQRVGMVQGMMAKKKVGHQEAYAAIIEEMNMYQETYLANEKDLPKRSCGGCEGGKVR